MKLHAKSRNLEAAASAAVRGWDGGAKSAKDARGASSGEVREAVR